MYVINKIIGGFMNPIGIGLMLILGGCLVFWLCECRRGSWSRRCGVWLGFLAFVWFWLCSTAWFCNLLRAPLERDAGEMRVEKLPTADAIVILGGGMRADTNRFPYAEMASGGDRAWHAARLYKAGKAPIVIPTGVGDRESTEPLLLDLGVPESAIVGEYEARNTEENARFVQRLLSKRSRSKVLLVTSAWHMKRSVQMYQKYAPGLEIIPAPTDYEVAMTADEPLSLFSLIPNKDVFPYTCALFKEHVGYWGYRLLR